MNKRGFTLVELLATIVILAIISTIALFSVSGMWQRFINPYYYALENNVTLSAKDYFSEHHSDLPKYVSYSEEITVDELESLGYIDEVKGKTGNNCSGKVVVYRKSNKEYEYQSCLVCDDYSTTEEYCEAAYNSEYNYVVNANNIEYDYGTSIPVLKSEVIARDNSKIMDLSPINLSALSSVMSDKSNVGKTFDIIYQYEDKEIKKTLSIVDKTGPNILLEPMTVSLAYGEGYDLNTGVSVSDLVDEDLSYTIKYNGSIITNPLEIARGLDYGSYTFVYNAQDSSENVAEEKTRTINIVDSIKPVITLSGESTMTLYVGETYIEPGYTASDNDDTIDITTSVTVTGTVDATTVGIYTLRYNVSDAAGNAADEKTRTVSVVPLVSTYVYQGNSEEYVVVVAGRYKIEGYGAQGSNGGKGGYISGEITLESGDVLTVTVGGSNGYNGGGTGSYSGGGATTIKKDGMTILQAAGGGGGAGGTIGGNGAGTGGAKTSATTSIIVNGTSFAGTTGTGGGGGGAGNKYYSCTAYNRIWNSCADTENTCSYGCDSCPNSCASTTNTCQYGCDSRWNTCKTTKNTCVPGYTCSTGTYVSSNNTCRQQSIGYALISQCTSFCNNRGGYCTFNTSSKYVCIWSTSAKYSSCKTGSPNVCVGGYEDYNCSNCKTGSPNACVSGYKDCNCDNCYYGSPSSCVGGYENGSCKTTGSEQIKAGKGGSNASSGLSNVTSTNGVQSGNGQIVITYIG